MIFIRLIKPAISYYPMSELCNSTILENPSGWYQMVDYLHIVEKVKIVVQSGPIGILLL